LDPAYGGCDGNILPAICCGLVNKQVIGSPVLINFFWIRFNNLPFYYGLNLNRELSSALMFHLTSNNSETKKYILENRQLSMLLIVCIGAYYIYSFQSNGFYQHDEAAHFLSMRRFWYDPSSILGTWAKPGFKLIYALPALLGNQAVTLFNCIISGLTVILSYKVAEELGFKWPGLSIPLMAVQPFWVQLTFRNYSELISACLLIFTIWLHLRNRRNLAALVLTYLTLIRQEFYVFLVLYGLYMVYRRNWIVLILLGIGPLIYNGWGWLATGDSFYLINSVIKTGSRYSNAYPRQGFNHYFIMSMVIFGPVVVTTIVYSIGLYIRRLVKPIWIILIPFSVYFLIHALFNLQLMEIGAPTGGNLRYILVISPLGALWANHGLEHSEYLKKDLILKLLMGAFLVAVGLFMSFEHNNIRFIDKRSWLPLIFSVLTVSVLAFTSRARTVVVAVVILVMVLLPLQIEPIERLPEDKTVHEVATWVEKNNALTRYILSNHTLLSYFLNRISQEYPNGHDEITRESVASAPPGTLIIWDSHYSYRPNLRKNTLPHSYFLDRPQEFKLVQSFFSSDMSFGIIVFEKME